MQVARATNPYIAGKSLRNPRGFYGREDVFELVREVFDSPDGPALVLFGQRRIGKTSILHQLKNRLDAPAFVPVYFDLMDRAHRPLQEVLFELAEEICSQAGTEQPDRAQFDSDGRFFRTKFLPNILEKLAGSRLILLLDEFDVLDRETERDLSPQSAGISFFPYIRALMNSTPSVGFIFVIGRKAEDLSIGLKATFKAARYKRISVLNPADARNLILSAARDGSLRFADSAADRILEITSGHPFFTQLLCALLWDRARKGRPAAPPLVEASEVDAIIPDVLEAGESFFEWIWDGLPSAERVIFSTIAQSTAEGATLTKERLAEILQGQGIRILSRELEIAPDTLVEWEMFAARDGQYRFFMELMRRWVAARKPIEKVKDELYRINPLADALYLSGDAYYRRADFELAINQLRQAVAANPNHLKARLLLGQISLEQNRTADAVTELEQAYKYDPDQTRYHLIRALLTRGDVLEREGDAKSAIALYTRVLEISPLERTASEQRAAIWVRFGDEALSAGDIAAAVEFYRKAEAADKLAETEAILHRRMIDSLREEALAAEAQENWALATQRYQELTDRDLENPAWVEGLDRARRMQSLAQRYVEGLGALDQQMWEVAQRAFADVVYNQPDYKAAAESLVVAVRGARSIAQASVEAPPVQAPVAFVESAPPQEPPAPTPEVKVSAPEVRLFKHGANIAALAASDRLLATADVDGVLRLWSEEDGSGIKLAEFPRALTAISFDRTARMLAVGTANGRIEVWTGLRSGQKPKRLHELSGNGAVTCLAFSGDSLLAATFNTGYLVVWPFPEVKNSRSVHAHHDGANAFAFSPLTKSTKSSLSNMPVSNEATLSSLIVPNSIATVGNDGIKLWDRKLKGLAWIKSEAPLTSAAFDQAGEVMAVGDDVGVVRFSDDPARKFFLGGKVSGLRFFGKCFLAAASFNQFAAVFDVPDNECLGILPHPAAVRSVAVIKDGASLVTGCANVARIWDIREIVSKASAAVAGGTT
jgi:tetratricopeptide (TPR) repeat protein